MKAGRFDTAVYNIQEETCDILYISFFGIYLMEKVHVYLCLSLPGIIIYK